MSFDIDANGILNVTAKDKATAKSQSIRIEGSTGISAEEVERMKKEAELHAMEDRKRQELIEVRNAADTLIYTSEKALKDAGDKVGEDVKKEVGEKLEALRKAKDGDNIEEIKQATEQLSKVLQKIGAAMYQNPPAGGQAQNPGDQKEEDKK